MGEMSSESEDLVLIVDDERPIADLLAEVVMAAGYRAVVAADGRQALALARERWPALVITDLMMPVLDGAELVAALRAEAATGGQAPPPVILMTAAGSAAARQVRADALLAKPFEVADVLQLVGRFLDRAPNGAVPADAARAAADPARSRPQRRLGDPAP
jgi:two-component system chemotaxis response regulator CheY